MISTFLYLRGGQGALAQLAQAFSIPPSNCTEYGVPADFSFYGREESGFSWAVVAGDFDRACDMNLHGFDQMQLLAALSRLSENGLTLAMIDDRSADPERFILFENGERWSVIVEADEILDEVHLSDQRRPILKLGV